MSVGWRRYHSIHTGHSFVVLLVITSLPLSFVLTAPKKKVWRSIAPLEIIVGVYNTQLPLSPGDDQTGLLDMHTYEDEVFFRRCWKGMGRCCRTRLGVIYIADVVLRRLGRLLAALYIHVAYGNCSCSFITNRYPTFQMSSAIRVDRYL